MAKETLKALNIGGAESEVIIGHALLQSESRLKARVLRRPGQLRAWPQT
jgi:hypothetical protein